MLSTNVYSSSESNKTEKMFYAVSSSVKMCLPAEAGSNL